MAIRCFAGLCLDRLDRNGNANRNGSLAKRYAFGEQTDSTLQAQRKAHPDLIMIDVGAGHCLASVAPEYRRMGTPLVTRGTRPRQELRNVSASTRVIDKQMTRVRVESFTISVDGYGAGPDQDVDNPLGVGGTDLHDWVIPTRTFQRVLFNVDGGTEGIDDEFASRSFTNLGAWILGRNMFGPIRGPWPDLLWKGWWGDDPPYHVPVFILTHHPRAPIQMAGNTTFHFVSGGIHEALDRARKAANGMDVRIGGGANTIQQYLRARLIDELHFAIAPVVLGRGERLFEGIDLRALGYECVKYVGSDKAAHVVLRRQ